MAMKLQTIQTMIELVTFIIAYMATVTMAGSFRAWVSYWCGDSTAKDLGFTSLNPWVHIDPMGLIFLLYFYFKMGLFFTWGRMVFINPENIRGYLRIPKLLCVYLSDTVCYFTISLVNLTLLITMFDIKMVSLAGYALIDRLSQAKLIAYYPEASPASITIAFILISSMYLALFLAVLSCVVNLFSMFLYLIAQGTGNEGLLTNAYVLIFVPLLLLIIFAGPLQILTIQLLLYAGNFIAQTLHSS